MQRSIIVPALFVLVLGGCDASPSRRNMGGGDGVDLVYGGASPDGATDDGSIDPGGGDDTCTDQLFTPQKAGDPDIILIQDTSGSMADGMPSKYSVMTGALGNVIASLDAQMSPIQWGLVIFPSDNDCGVDAKLPVPVGMGKGAAVVAAIKAHSPGGNTPLTAGVQAASNYYDTLNDGRAHYLLIATDGEPNCDNGGGLPKTCMKNADCGPNQVCQVVPILGGFCVDQGGGASAMAVSAAAKKGIKTYVVGIDLGGDSVTLDALAVAGGTARMGNPKYYPVADQASLENALKNITSQIISCSFKLSSLPMQNEMIQVEIAGQMISRDKTHMNGWDIDDASMTLTFYGNTCVNLQMNPAQVKVGYTCPPPG